MVTLISIVRVVAVTSVRVTFLLFPPAFYRPPYSSFLHTFPSIFLHHFACPPSYNSFPYILPPSLAPTSIHSHDITSSHNKTWHDMIGMEGAIDCKSYQFLDARDRDGGRKSLLRGLAKVTIHTYTHTHALPLHTHTRTYTHTHTHTHDFKVLLCFIHRNNSNSFLLTFLTNFNISINIIITI